MQRHLATTTAATMLAGVLTACGTDSGSGAGTASPSAAAAGSIYARCQAQEWPRPMPDLEGRPFDPLGKDLMCFNHIEAMAPDGHDVMGDPANGLDAWTVKSSDPGPGAKVRMTTPITLQLRPAGG
ncbi:hypothetical protein [Streptomyces aureus]|uniref:hypothetical protein n=2 Tax=Streptomyces aureus TaxID=193461 RepID=UPI0033F906A5